MNSMQLSNASMSDLLTFAEENGFTIPENLRQKVYQKAIVEYLTRNVVNKHKAAVEVLVNTTKECKLLVKQDLVNEYVVFLENQYAQKPVRDFINSGYELREDLGVITDVCLLFNYSMIKKVEPFAHNLPFLGTCVDLLRGKYFVITVELPQQLSFNLNDESLIKPITPNSVVVDGQLFTNCTYSIRTLRIEEDSDDESEEKEDSVLNKKSIDFSEMDLEQLQNFARENLPDTLRSIDDGIYLSRIFLREYLEVRFNSKQES